MQVRRRNSGCRRCNTAAKKPSVSDSGGKVRKKPSRSKRLSTDAFRTEMRAPTPGSPETRRTLSSAGQSFVDDLFVFFRFEGAGGIHQSSAGGEKPERIAQHGDLQPVMRLEVLRVRAASGSPDCAPASRFPNTARLPEFGRKTTRAAADASRRAPRARHFVFRCARVARCVARRRGSWRSAATTLPFGPTARASSIALPPGAAHTSSTLSPGRASTRCATIWDASS